MTAINRVLYNVDQRADLTAEMQRIARENIGIDLGKLATKEELETLGDAKQDALTAGDNITISNKVISAKDTTYTAGEGIKISSGYVISAEIPEEVFIANLNTGTMTGTGFEDISAAIFSGKAVILRTATTGASANFAYPSNISSSGIKFVGNGFEYKVNPSNVWTAYPAKTKSGTLSLVRETAQSVTFGNYSFEFRVNSTQAGQVKITNPDITAADIFSETQTYGNSVSVEGADLSDGYTAVCWGNGDFKTTPTRMVMDIASSVEWVRLTTLQRTESSSLKVHYILEKIK